MPARRIFLLALIGGCLFVALGVWLNSGTMSPYAISLPRPLIIKPCNYLVNTDQPHFEASYLMLQGRRAEEWKYSVVLRRTLYPILAYPLMRAWGFLVGGVVTSLIMQIAAFAGFVIWVRRRIGEAAAWAAMPLLATYPGIYYWAGLPYCYAAIVPATLACTIIVYELQSAQSYQRVAILALLLGVLFLAYDLLAYFAPAAVLILAMRRKFIHAAIAAVLMIVPGTINKWALLHAGADMSSENSRFYALIFNAYFHGHLSLHPLELAWSLIRVFFFSNFLFLPAMFLIALVVNRATGWRVPMGPAVRWVLLTALGLFLFINLAPPYKGWQFRGVGVSRIYQPVFAAMLVHILMVIESMWQERLNLPAFSAVACVFAGCVLLNISIVFGPMTKNPLAAWSYLKFYAHAARPMMNENLALFGRRPLGFCNHKIKIQNPPPRVLGAGRHKKPPLAQRKKTHAQLERERQQQLLHPSPPAVTKKRKKVPLQTTAPASAPSARAAFAAPCRDG